MADAEPDQPSDGIPASDDASPESSSADASSDDASPEDGATDSTSSGDQEPDDSTSDDATPDGRTEEPVGGTVPAWWTWVGRHRKPVILVALVVVVAVAGTLVAVSTVGGQSPRDVVQSYLDAIRSGDTQAALEIAGEPADDGRLRFLSSDALADDWAVDAVVERHVRENEADVDVTLRAGKTAQQGRFHVVKGDDGWTIESPFVKVDFTVGDLDVVELGDVRQPVERDETTQAVPLLLFPGVYELYPSLKSRITFDQPLLVATPREANDTTVRFTAAYTLTGGGAEAAQKAVNASVDRCAAQPVVSPPGCPFDVAENSTVWGLDEVTDVAWTVQTHPVAFFVQERNTGGISLVVRKPGTVRVTGTGMPEDGGARTPFALTCEFGLDNLTLAVTQDGIEIGNVTGDEYSAPLATECF
jgi:hypothetical protein